MNWYRWSLRGSWHIGSDASPKMLCGRTPPETKTTEVLVGVEPLENQKTCETCLRSSHRAVENDL